MSAEVDMVQLAKRAGQSAGSIAVLHGSLSGVVAGVVYLIALFVDRSSVLIPPGLSFLGAVVLFAILVALVVGAISYPLAKRQIEAAKAEHAAHLHAAEARRRAETEARITAMKTGEQG
ncbi:MAG: hypothetical protein AAFR17_04295 [Pseudomonadota bacterium]